MSDGVKIRVTQTGRVKPPNLDNGQLTAIGREMVEAQKLRWSKAINADGNPAKPLSKKYLFMKKKFTGASRPRRDMKMTGQTVANFGLRKAINGVIRAENSTRETRRRAQRASDTEQMIGFSGSDQVTVFRESQTQYGKFLQRAWVPLK
jgi:hypothetical protein